MTKTAKVIIWLVLGLPIIVIALLYGALQVFIEMSSPNHAFGTKPVPTAPDYALRSNWAGWPAPGNPADRLPPGVMPVAFEARPAAAFFVHPTTFGSSDYYVQPMDDEKVRRGTDYGTISTQASAFNDCCAVYAPRYRQSGLPYVEGDVGHEVFAIGYGDVRRAFFHFLDEIGDDTPFILASHSQGSFHLVRLVMEEVSETSLTDRLIAVYAIGHRLPMALVDEGLTDIDICESPLQLGCFISWDSHRGDRAPIEWVQGEDNFWNGVDYTGYKTGPAICVNPITWTTDSVPSKKENHLGALSTFKAAASLSEPLSDLIKNDISVQCGTDQPSNWLFVNADRSDRLKTQGLFSIFERNLHGYDFDYYWANIRQNARDRSDEFVSKKLKQ